MLFLIEVREGGEGLLICICGRKLIYKSHKVNYMYKNKTITINNVPLYLCEDDHIRFTIGSKIKIKKLLKEAHEKQVSELDFE